LRGGIEHTRNAALVTVEGRAVLVSLWDVTAGVELPTGHRASVKCLAAAEVGGRTVVASGDQGNSLHFWDLDTRERLGWSSSRRSPALH
jgi:hypothetical protein